MDAVSVNGLSDSKPRHTALLMSLLVLCRPQEVALQPPDTSTLDWELNDAWAAIDANLHTEWQPPSVQAARAAASVIAAVSAQLGDEAFLAAALLRIQEVRADNCCRACLVGRTKVSWRMQETTLLMEC